MRTSILFVTALLAGCSATTPGDDGNTLSLNRASVTGPAQCRPAPTPQGGVGCEWRNAARNRLFLTLDEQEIVLPVPQTDPTARLAAALAGFNQRVSGYPGFAGMQFFPVDKGDLPGPDVACALYGYSQIMQGSAELPGKVAESAGLGQLCVDTDGPPDSARLVIAELNISWGSNLGERPSVDDGKAAREVLATLRIE